MTNVLPQGWAMAPINRVADVNPRHPRDLDENLEVSFAPMACLSESNPTMEGVTYRPLGQVRTGFTHFAEGDVLFAKITPCMENGKGAVALGLKNGLGCGTTELHVLRPSEFIEPQYLYHFTHQPSFRKLAEARFTGSAGQARVPAAFFGEAEILLPPITEQRRIIAKMDALLAKVDSSRKKLEHIPIIIKRFRQAILAAACTGRLTAEWREHSVQTSGQCNTEKSVIDGLPPSWQWQSVGSLCERLVDCPHSTPVWTDSGRVCVRTTNFKPGLLDLSEVRYVSEETFNRRNERLIPQPGDVLFSREGGILGIACMVPDGATLCLGQRMMLFRTKESLDARLLMHWLNGPSIQRVVVELTGGTAAPHLNVKDIKAFLVPLPPPNEQQELLRRLGQFSALADQMEARYNKAKIQVDRLTQSILAKAFRGELVPQDPNDEPVEVFMKRLKDTSVGASTPRRRGRPRKAMD